MGTTLDSISIKKIKVFLYSYKNKDLLDFCINLKKNSINDIFIDIYDRSMKHSERQCDQMAKIFAKIWPFTTKICPIASKCKNSLSILPSAE